MDKSDNILNRARFIAVISGVFTALVSILLIFNYVQISLYDPLDSQVMKQMVARLSSEPGNEELIREIRQMDLLARRAYFNSLWQLRTGAALLLAGAITLIVSLRFIHRQDTHIEKPEGNNINEKQVRIRSQKWIAATGMIIILLAVLSALFSSNHLRQFDTERLADTASVDEEDGIEKLQISSRVAGDDPVGEPADEPEEETGEVVETISRITMADLNENHNSLRGPLGHGITPHSNLPLNWDGETGENILWKTEIEVHGYNSPVIWEDRMFFSGANDQRRVVYCLDRHSGELLWEREATDITGSPSVPPETTDDTGLAAPSLTTDPYGVYAIFGTGDIIAFSHHGERLWARNLGVPENHYGHSSSLITWDGKVFVQYDTAAGSRLLALDVADGSTVWETPRDNDISWASPILIEQDGSMRLIVLSNPNLDAYDIDNGEQLWSVDCMSGEVGPSPAYGGGLVYAANEYATMVAVDPSDGSIVWEDRYYLPEVSSPVYHDGYLYIATTYAVLACFDAQTGDFIWEFDGEDRFYSSPVIAEGRIYAFDTSGRAYIIEPGDEPVLVSSPDLGDPIYSTPVFADGKLYIRSNTHVYCIGDN